jgi:hypothetical protein
MKYYSLFILSVLSINAFSQVTNEDSINKIKFNSFTDKLFNRFSIRQSFQGKAEKEEAAFFNVVNPTGKQISYNYSFAIGYTLSQKINLTPFFEWQKNNLIDKKQDNLLSGVELQTPLLPKNEKLPVPYIIVRLNYKNDQIKSTQGLQGSFYGTLSFNGVRDGILCPLPDVVNNFHWISFYYNPYLGFEYEGRFTATADSLKGNTERFYLRITSNIYPLSSLLDRRLEIVPDFIYRKAISNTSKAEKNENCLFKIDFNVILFRKKISEKSVEFKFGVNYTNGSDPSKSFEKQEVTTWSFKIKV